MRRVPPACLADRHGSGGTAVAAAGFVGAAVGAAGAFVGADGTAVGAAGGTAVGAAGGTAVGVGVAPQAVPKEATRLKATIVYRIRSSRCPDQGTASLDACNKSGPVPVP